MRKLARHFIVAGLLLAAGCASTQQTDVAASKTTAPWVNTSALYEVFVRDFSPAGNFQGVIDGLDRIQATGANVVWIMPIHPVGVLNRKMPLGSSYSVADYEAINPDYGNAADLHRLVDAVHKRGMKIILDFVPNHTAWDNVWVKKYPDRYTRDANGNMIVPRDNEGKPTDWTDVADLNYSNPDTRQAMITDMRYWLERFNLDGYRMDVAGFVPDDFWREAIPQLRSIRPIMMLAEWGDLKMHNLGFDLTYGWDGYAKLKEVWKGAPASSFVTREVQETSVMPSGGMRMRFTTNHDETAWDKPPVSLFGGHAGARAAFVAIALMPGRPLLYNGEEVESPQVLGLFVKEPVAWNQPNADAARAFYRRVIEISRNNAAFTSNALQAVQTSASDDVIAYRRGNAVVLVNARNRPVTAAVSGTSIDGARDLLAGGTQHGNTVNMPAYGALVLELSK